MGKLVICLVFGLVIAGIMLELRQQYLSLNYETDRLHSQIESRQARLWSQQLRIAEETAPNAIAAKVKQERIPLAPQSNPRAEMGLDSGQAVQASDR